MPTLRGPYRTFVAVVPVRVEGLYSGRVVGGVLCVVVAVLVRHVRLVVMVAGGGVVAHGHAILNVFVFRSVLFPGIAVRSRGRPVVRHVLEVVRGPVGAAVVVLVFDISNEVTVATILDDVVFMIQRVVSLQALYCGVAVRVVVVGRRLHAVVPHIWVVFDQMVGHALTGSRVARFR